MRKCKIQDCLTKLLAIVSCTVLAGFLTSSLLRGDDRSWTFAIETVDSNTRFTSIAVDRLGNLHLAYINSADTVSYAFRDVSTAKWFHTLLDNRASFTSLALDPQGNPNICYTQAGIHYAHWDGKAWQKEQISEGSGTIAYSCAVGVSRDGIPHVTWYQERTAQDTNYLHMRYAYLDNGTWLVKTIDWDAQTGKWHTMVLDKQGYPHISFDSFVSGQLKYANWDGRTWHIHAVDSRKSSDQSGRGMGNSLVLDSKGLAMISYYEDSALKYARQKDDGTWTIETLASTFPSPTWAGYRTEQALDSQGLPHLVYEDAGMLRHMYWDGQVWHTQIIARPGEHRLRYASIAISSEDVIYISYCDPDDGSLKVAVGRLTASNAATQKEKSSNR